jgi:hypothetical protein
MPPLRHRDSFTFTVDNTCVSTSQCHNVRLWVHSASCRYLCVCMNTPSSVGTRLQGFVSDVNITSSL